MNRRFGVPYRFQNQGEKIVELGTTLTANINRSTLMMEAINSSETFVLTRATSSTVPEDGILLSDAFRVL
jgi:hypothetical protein